MRKRPLSEVISLVRQRTTLQQAAMLEAHAWQRFEQSYPGPLTSARVHSMRSEYCDALIDAYETQFGPLKPPTRIEDAVCRAEADVAAETIREFLRSQASK